VVLDHRLAELTHFRALAFLISQPTDFDFRHPPLRLGRYFDPDGWGNARD
jgi:hypothetical protein